jgi:hypothetical protein
MPMVVISIQNRTCQDQRNSPLGQQAIIFRLHARDSRKHQYKRWQLVEMRTQTQTKPAHLLASSIGRSLPGLCIPSLPTVFWLRAW